MVFRIMKNLNVSTAIIIGAIIIFLGIIFNGWYERNLSYNMCVRLVNENPFDESKYQSKNFIKDYCEWNVIVKRGNDPNFILNYETD